MEETSQHGDALAQPLLTQPQLRVKAIDETGDFTSLENAYNDPDESGVTVESDERCSLFQFEGPGVDDGQDDDSGDGFKLLTQSNDLFKDNALNDDGESSSDGSSDDNSQISSSGGEDDEDYSSTDEKKDDTPLQERRERNIRRREAWWQLKLNAIDATGQCNKRKREIITKHEDVNAPGRDVGVNEEPTQRKRRGMIISISSTSNNHRPPDESIAIEPPLTTRSLMDDLEPNYPHRSKEIRILCSHLIAIVQKSKFAWQMNEKMGSFGYSQYSEASYQGDTKLAAPAPIMITGAAGVGKTCIVRDAMKALQKRTSGGRGSGAIAHAYVDCASLESGTVAAAMNSAYRQLYRCCQLGGNSGRSGKVRMKGSVKPGGERVKNNLGTAQTTLKGDDFEAEFESETEDIDAVAEDQIERQRKRKWRKSNGSKTSKKARDTVSVAKKSIIPQKNAHQTRLQEKLATKAASEPAFDKPTSLKGSIQGNVYRNTQNSGSVALFGRVASGLIQGGAKKKSSKNNWQCAFLILDSADQILSWKKHGSITPLTQIFLLPSVMGINLTLILISRSTILQNSSLHNAPAALLDAVHPQRIHFDSYTSVDMIKTICHAPRVNLSIIGHSTKKSHIFSCMIAKTLRSKLNELLYSSMMNSFIPSVKSTTQHLTEIMKLARLLWAEYVAPFERAHASDDPSLKTLVCQVLLCLSRDADFMSDHGHDPNSSFCQCLAESAKADDDVMDLDELKQRLSEKLDRNIRDGVRRLLSNTAMMPGRVLLKQSVEPYAKKLPYTTKFLLLAAFLCQSKRQEQDVNLFTKKNTGKSKRNHAKKSGDGLTHASSKDVKQRQPSFPLERLFSVFHSIIEQYGQHFMDYKEEGAVIFAQLGTERLFQNVSQLIESGLLSSTGSAKLHERCNHNLIEMASAKFSGKISKDDAISIASSVGFPLEKYCP